MMKRIVNLGLGIFVLVAVALVGWQSISGRAATTPAPAPAHVTASLAAAPPVAENPVPQSAAPAPAVAAPPATPATAVNPAAFAAGAIPVMKEPRAAAATIATPSRKIVAMYFHGDVRCTTCRKVEAYAKEAVEEGFKDRMAAGQVEFRAVNVDQLENRHFIEDYRLTSRSVVVAEEVGGAVTRWVKLDQVWSLVGDRPTYLVYVQDAVRAYVEN